MKDEHSAGIEVSQTDLDRLCDALAAIALDWWRGQVHADGVEGEPAERPIWLHPDDR
jgi:hypothetical protein